ncbi:MAG TPA: amidase family protein [Dehalococcoidales bacterium]
MTEREIGYMSAFDMAAAIKAKKLSPVEVVEAILTRIERLNPKVNAYCTVLAESARREAKDAETAVMKKRRLRPLHGVPVSIKDLIFTKGVRTTFGSKIYEDFIPPEDAVVVERLRAAGAIIVGKTNTPEFGFMGVTDNLIFGPTRNPWNLGLTAGGSSGGAAAAVAAGLGPVAIGTDGGGSIRIPSSFCGVFGLKPSFGRVPRGPGFTDWQTLSHTGPISRTVRDAALTMEIIAGRDNRDRHSLPGARLRYLSFLGGDLKGLKIAWSPDLGYAVVDPQVLEITSKAVGVFEMLGAKLEATDPPAGNPGMAFTRTWGIMLATRYGSKLAEWREQMNPRLVAMIERYMSRSVDEFAQAAVVREEYYMAMRSFFEKYDLLLTPSVAVPPFEVGKFEITEIAGVKGSPALDWNPFTYPFNFTGQPVASVPCGWTADGRPVGLQIVGRPLDDVTVLRAAAAFEQASPWADKEPPLD